MTTPDPNATPQQEPGQQQTPEPSTQQPDSGAVDQGMTDLQQVLADLGLEPGQIAGRLKAGKTWEQRAKDNQAAAGKAATLEERLTALETRNIELEQKEQERVQAEQRAKDVAEVAKAKGVDPELLGLMNATTREEIETAAGMLAAKAQPAKSRYLDPAAAQGGGDPAGGSGTPDFIREGLARKAGR